MKLRNIASFDVDPQIGFTPLGNELVVNEGHLIGTELNANAKLSSKRILSRDLHVRSSEWDTNDPTKIGTNAEGQNPNVDALWVEHCIHGERGADILDELPDVITGYDFQVVKGTERTSHPYGACYTDLQEKQHTGVIAQLKMWDIDTVIVGGLAFDVCVLHTVRQLREYGFTVYVNLASTRAVFPENNAETKKTIESLGAKCFEDSKAIAAYLEGN